MNTCPVNHQLRRDLPPLPPRIAALPVDDLGYPVPYFVAWIDGKPDFRVADSNKMNDCHGLQLCWICGQNLGSYKTFPIGPMCAVNRTTAEPPSHLDCAEWSVRGCPFLSKPKAKRREDEMTEACKGNVAGEMIERNPGVTCLWTTRSYKLFPDGAGKMLIEIGAPESVSWWREGRTATRAEIMESISTGLPRLEACIELEKPKDRPAARRELEASVNRAMKLLPA
jgi:hypothetical protein